MVIHDLNIFGTPCLPIKADAPLIVDTNAVLPGTVAFEHLKTISGWHSQIIYPASDLELSQLASCNRRYIHKALYANALCKGFSISTFKWSDHIWILTHRMNNVKHDDSAQHPASPDGGGSRMAGQKLKITICRPIAYCRPI
jgi:hypothetical protein